MMDAGMRSQEQGQNDYNRQVLGSEIDYSPDSESSGASQIQQLRVSRLKKGED